MKLNQAIIKWSHLSLQELDNLNSRKAILDDEVAVSAVKKEALSLYDSLREIEKKRDDLINEEKNRGTPAQERERLLNQVLNQQHRTRLKYCRINAPGCQEYRLFDGVRLQPR